MTTTIADVLRKIDDDLAWRGPGGGLMGNIVLTREQAEHLREWVVTLAIERDELVAEVERLNKQCEGLAQSAMNNGQDLLLKEAEIERLEKKLRAPADDAEFGMKP